MLDLAQSVLVLNNQEIYRPSQPERANVYLNIKYTSRFSCGNNYLKIGLGTKRQECDFGHSTRDVVINTENVEKRYVNSVQLRYANRPEKHYDFPLLA